MMVWQEECAKCGREIAVLGPPPAEDTPAYCPKHRPLQGRLL